MGGPVTAEILDHVENLVLDDGTHDKFTHIVVEGFWAGEGEDRQFYPETPVVDGQVFGNPVKALCGKVWVPGDDPQKYEICPTCVEIAKQHGWSVPGK